MIRFKSLALAAALLSCGAADAASLKISCSAVGQELELCRTRAQAWAKQTGHEVRVVATPNDSIERLALFQQVLSSRSDRIDVFQIDVVWPGLLARHLADLRPYTAGVEKEHFEAFIANNTVDGRLVAMPWFTDAGLLFYRTDLLAKHNKRVPVTWEELAGTAHAIQNAERAAGNAKMWGYVWQGRAYEGLTCNALEWLASYGGGAIIDASGKITVRNPNAMRALQTAASWVGTITPKAVLNYAEEEARGVFQSGNAVFMRNWPYAWALAQNDDSPVKGKVGLTVLPRGALDGGEDSRHRGRHAAALGGGSLAVSKYSKNLALAADLVMFMTSSQAQKQRAIAGSFNPTLPALYKDAEILRINPFMGELFGTFQNAVARPTTVAGTRYNQVSNEFWNAVHSVLTGRASADAALADLEQRLNRVSRGGRWK